MSEQGQQPMQPPRGERRFSPEVDLLRRFLLVGEVVAILGSLIFAASFALSRSPVSLGAAVFVTGVVWPAIRYGRRLAERGRTLAGLNLFSTVMWIAAAMLAARGGITLAIALPLAVLPMVVAVPLVSRRALGIRGIATLGICALCAVAAVSGPFFPSTLSEAQLEDLIALLVPLILGPLLLAVWFVGVRLRATLVETQQANLALAESERVLERKVELRTKELARTVEEMSDLNEVSRTVNSTLDLDRVVETINLGLRKVFAFDQIGVLRLDEAGERMLLEQQAGEPLGPELEDLWRSSGLRLGDEDSAMVAAIEKRRTLYVPVLDSETVQSLSPGDRAIYDANPMKSLLLCPLEIRDEVIGAIYFGSLREPFTLDETNIETIQRYVTTLGTALQNARLFEEAEAARAELAEINELARAVNETLDLDRVMEIAMGGLQKVFPFDQTLLVVPDRDCGVVRAARPTGPGFTPEMIELFHRFEIPLEESNSIWVNSLSRRQPLYLPSIGPELLERMSPSDRRLYELDPLRSLLLLPLELHGEIVGSIMFGNSTQILDLSEAEIERIQRYVTPVATALQNARLFEEAEVARAGAQEANQTKSSFLANMSHELRTPLNAIIGYSEMLKEEAEDDGHESYVPDLGRILSSGRHLLELINGVLDLAKIESGKMEVYLEDFDVAELVKGVEGTILPLVRQNANQIELSGLDDVGRMHSDTTKLRQMLFNLLSNASKFTREGVIRLQAERTTEDGEDWLHFRVTDSGIGMNEEQLGKVFEEFSQADATTTREYGGTGLGLPITKKFCEMLGGTIEATSEPGQGSSFEIRLPARTPAPEVEESASEAEAESVAVASEGAPTVLVIDDDAAARDLIGRLLGAEGYGVLTASGGAEGLRLAREQHPDLITLDVIMPHVDGWTVLQQLKADPELAAIPVILLTMTDDRNLGFALGAAEYLTKPIDRDELAAVLRKYEGGDPAATALVVDDDPNARDMLRRGLERAGWPVVEAENGRVALDRVAEAVPRLILLDLMMPEMDGFEFVAELRKNEAWRAIPVLVITAKEITAEDRARLEGNVARIFQKGAFGRDDLLREVRSLVGTRSPARSDTPT